jgi:hypothetical protein
MSTNFIFLDLRVKSYESLKFLGEVSARRACAGTNQQELTTCAKSLGQEEDFFCANGEFRAPSRGRRATAGRRPAVPTRLVVGDPWSPSCPDSLTV